MSATEAATMESPQMPANYDGEQPLNIKMIKESSRIDINALMNEFRHELEPSKWDSYRDSLTHFLMGKLSRAELIKCFKDEIGMTNMNIRNHNALILSLLANACRESPPGVESSLAEWKSTSRSKTKLGMDSADDRLHREILSLPVRERRRIKAIVKESQQSLKQPLIPPQLPSLIVTRQEMLPHIPYVQDAKSSKDVNGKAVGPSIINTSGSQTNVNISTSDAVKNGSANSCSSSVKIAHKDSTNSLLDPMLNLHSGKSSGPLTWTQDIVQALDTPLISEAQEFPDDNGMCTRMLGIALEHGLLNGVGVGTTDMMFLGLEVYLRNIVNQLIAIKHRRVDSSNPLTAADFNMIAEMRSAEIGSQVAPMFRLRTNYLRDETTVEPAQKRENPWDISSMHKPKVLKLEQQPELSEEATKLRNQVIEEHKKGISVLEELIG